MNSNASYIKAALVKLGFAPREKLADDNDEFNDVEITYKGEQYYGSSLVSIEAAYKDLLQDVPEELSDRVMDKVAEI